MALFDEDNPGKNLANATIWLESSEDSGDSGNSGSPGGSGCSFRTILYILAGIVILGSLVVTAITNTM